MKLASGYEKPLSATLELVELTHDITYLPFFGANSFDAIVDRPDENSLENSRCTFFCLQV